MYASHGGREFSKSRKNLDDFLTLLSPAASPIWRQWRSRHSSSPSNASEKTIQLYAPLYVSNECQNICTYCGFSMDNKIRRKTLSTTELVMEALALKSMGVDHVLLVSGEANKIVDRAYFERAIQTLSPYFSQISIEVQPLDQPDYELLQAAGTHAVLVYQETYHQDVYKQYHPKGKKSNFDYRLATPDRIAQSGFHKIGLGVLLGLEDWRVDSFLTPCTSTTCRNAIGKPSILYPFRGYALLKVSSSRISSWKTVICCN